MHRGPEPANKLTWEDGEPMDKAGHNTYRGENVAIGFTTPADVMRSWMQDDEAWSWGHRNFILNCTIQEAGVGHHQGGPVGHYWTLDMGTRELWPALPCSYRRTGRDGFALLEAVHAPDAPA
ncbi:CAP domain-containing protein [Streptomyces sp. XY332]|uniref:CAP domain-containing protein n=1 Tax=Streptomyces sp. XY332 TaxID=1415561 RepID=UPI000D147BCC|nr:CAP domain-containing protein [Streptomyces sp. XY332]